MKELGEVGVNSDHSNYFPAVPGGDSKSVRGLISPEPSRRQWHCPYSLQNIRGFLLPGISDAHIYYYFIPIWRLTINTIPQMSPKHGLGVQAPPMILNIKSEVSQMPGVPGSA